MRLYDIPPVSNSAAWRVFEDFLADPRITLVDEPAGVETRWKKLASRRTPSPKLWMDAYLAAFAIAGQYQLITTDKAFKQFHGLKIIALPSGGSRTET